MKGIIHHDQVGFIPGLQNCFNRQETTDVLLTEKRKGSLIIVSIDAEKNISQGNEWGDGLDGWQTLRRALIMSTGCYKATNESLNSTPGINSIVYVH